MFHAVVMVHVGGETPLHGQPRQITRARLPERLNGRFAPGRGSLELPAIIDNSLPVIVERGLGSEGRRKACPEKEKQTFHDWRML